MRPVMNIEKHIKGIYADGLCVAASPSLDRRVLSNAMDTLEGLKREKSAAIRPNIWRTIMKSQITRFAAVVAVAVVVILALHYGPIDITNAAFAQMAEMAEAMGNMPCVHAVIEGRRDGKEHRRENWFSFESGIMCEKNQDGTVSFVNIKSSEKYFFSPGSGKIIISRSFKESLDEINSPQKFLQQMLRELGILGAEMTVEKGRYEGKDVDIYRAELLATDYSPAVKMFGKGELMADRYTHLPLYGRLEGYGPNGAVLLEGTIVFDYPQGSPRSIYELGVPKSADIIDSSPTQQVKELLSSYRFYRNNAQKDTVLQLSERLHCPQGKPTAK